MIDLRARIAELTARLYPGRERLAFELVWELCAGAGAPAPCAPAPRELDEHDALLICYGDSLRRAGERPLATLGSFLRGRAAGFCSAVHVLPFHPSTSDDGFSVADYTAVDPALGTWDDLRALSGTVDLMVDAVVNHVSRSHAWFVGFLAGDPAFADWFIVPRADEDYRAVVRPRALPLLTPFSTASGTRRVWTTFSEDQVDLNYANPRVLREILAVLLGFAARGARFIRLDAIGFIWKRPDTSCMHLGETHDVVRLMRAVVEATAPGTFLVTETNVPHEQNVAYFGTGDEAHLVYQFPLPPLVVHALLAGSARRLSAWAVGMLAQPLPARATYLNFLASHDGIGLRPLEGILEPGEIDTLVHATLARGGRIGYRASGHRRVPYELNVSLLSLLSDPRDHDDEPGIARFLAAHAILLAMPGVPGIYVHSLLGSSNWTRGVEESLINRRINRQKLDIAEVESGLDDPGSTRARVFTALGHLLRARRCEPAFHPRAFAECRMVGDRVFCLLRRATAGGREVVCAVNVSAEPARIALERDGYDLVAGERLSRGTVALGPYQARWIAAAARD